MTTAVAVTGATGFCGRHIAAALLATGLDVATLGRRPSEPLRHAELDLDGLTQAAAARSLAALGLRPGDAVVHSAAAVGDSGDRAAFERINIGGTRALLSACSGLGLRFIHISSASVYAAGRTAQPLPEGSPLGGHRDPYSHTKSVADAEACAAGAVVLRPRAVYGPDDPHLLPRLAAARRGSLLPLPGPSRGMSVTHVKNLAQAVVDALDWPAGAYNIADSESVDRDAAIQAALTALGLPTRIVHIPILLATGTASASEAMSFMTSGHPRTTRYAVRQLAQPLVLDTSKARHAGYDPEHTWNEFVRRLTAAGITS